MNQYPVNAALRFFNLLLYALADLVSSGKVIYPERNGGFYKDIAAGVAAREIFY